MNNKGGQKMIIIDIILGTVDWIKIKTRRNRLCPIFWWPVDNGWKTCVKARIIERKLKKY